MEPTRRLAFLALAAAFACAVPAARAGDLHGFASDKTHNLFGYYMPTRELRFGKFVLNNFAVGEPSDFRTYETGKNRIATYGPLMFGFDDTTSAQKQGETGAYYVNAPRVLPVAYKLAGNTVVFIGMDKQLGSVVLSGTFDLAAIKAAQVGSNGDKPVLTGDLTVGTKTIKNVTFTWFGGD